MILNFLFYNFNNLFNNLKLKNNEKIFNFNSTYYFYNKNNFQIELNNLSSKYLNKNEFFEINNNYSNFTIFESSDFSIWSLPTNFCLKSYFIQIDYSIDLNFSFSNNNNSICIFFQPEIPFFNLNLTFETKKNNYFIEIFTENLNNSYKCYKNENCIYNLVNPFFLRYYSILNFNLTTLMNLKVAKTFISSSECKLSKISKIEQFDSNLFPLNINFIKCNFSSDEYIYIIKFLFLLILFISFIIYIFL